MITSRELKEEIEIARVRALEWKWLEWAVQEGLLPASVLKRVMEGEPCRNSPKQ